MIANYYCRAMGRVSQYPFSKWHLCEAQGVCASGIRDRDRAAKLTRLQALELVNKWNFLATHTDGGKYWIGAG